MRLEVVINRIYKYTELCVCVRRDEKEYMGVVVQVQEYGVGVYY